MAGGARAAHAAGGDPAGRSSGDRDVDAAAEVAIGDPSGAGSGGASGSLAPRRHGPGLAFLLLILVQAVHSLEEYVFRLYDVFLPARFVAERFGIDRPAGFAVANTALVLFGLWCWIARVRPERPGGRGLAWFWAILETGNGLAHVGLAIAAGGYFPGFATAPLLLASAAWLIIRLRASAGR